jgi:hypothetical protein
LSEGARAQGQRSDLHEHRHALLKTDRRRREP